MEVRNCPRNDCETGCGIPSPNETLIHAQSDTDNNSASSAVSSEVVEEKLKEKVAEFENSLRQKLQSQVPGILPAKADTSSKEGTSAPKENQVSKAMD